MTFFIGITFPSYAVSQNGITDYDSKQLTITHHNFDGFVSQLVITENLNEFR